MRKLLNQSDVPQQCRAARARRLDVGVVHHGHAGGVGHGRRTVLVLPADEPQTRQAASAITFLQEATPTPLGTSGIRSRAVALGLSSDLVARASRRRLAHLPLWCVHQSLPLPSPFAFAKLLRLGGSCRLGPANCRRASCRLARSGRSASEVEYNAVAARWNGLRISQEE